ncbi:hypothetical protein THASP1DRAFT_30813 [Thamnocephalis sphaerospora]|uniref:Uncharacterized protein n=1 Tax=Thamnocephalis sphaerospora TaxID=78915 RepID=A0A4P9XNH5_9FUNG|nr:hypothetical protein THASP1DRAFT_30813 [Thamnocephalis sphaerospora]|eukprot:RKP07372.1 hypothetical protein THASP1DRAFT_30813 [Thamnocephalis sphaerospora]
MSTPIATTSDGLWTALALERGVQSLCLLVFLVYALAFTRYFRSHSHRSVTSTDAAAAVGFMAAMPMGQHRPAAIHPKLAAVHISANMAMIACALSLLLRISLVIAVDADVSYIPRQHVLGHVDSVGDSVSANFTRPSETLVFAGTHEGNSEQNVANKLDLNVHIALLLAVLADTLLLMALWLALAERAFALCVSVRDGGHSRALTGFWLTQQPILGWTCVVVAMFAIPLTELMAFFVFGEQLAMARNGTGANAVPWALADPSANVPAADATLQRWNATKIDAISAPLQKLDQKSDTSAAALLDAGQSGWALAHLITGCWFAAYAIAAGPVALAIGRRRAEIDERRHRATGTSVALPSRASKIFSRTLNLVALPSCACLLTMLASTQACFVFRSTSSDTNIQTALAGVWHALMPVLHLLLIVSLSAVFRIIHAPSSRTIAASSVGVAGDGVSNARSDASIYDAFSTGHIQLRDLHSYTHEEAGGSAADLTHDAITQRRQQHLSQNAAEISSAARLSMAEAMANDAISAMAGVVPNVPRILRSVASGHQRLHSMDATVESPPAATAKSSSVGGEPVSSPLIATASIRQHASTNAYPLLRRNSSIAWSLRRLRSSITRKQPRLAERSGASPADALNSAESKASSDGSAANTDADDAPQWPEPLGNGRSRAGTVPTCTTTWSQTPLSTAGIRRSSSFAACASYNAAAPASLHTDSHDRSSSVVELRGPDKANAAGSNSVAPHATPAPLVLGSSPAVPAEEHTAQGSDSPMRPSISTEDTLVSADERPSHFRWPSISSVVYQHRYSTDQPSPTANPPSMAGSIRLNRLVAADVQDARASRSSSIESGRNHHQANGVADNGQQRTSLEASQAIGKARPSGSLVTAMFGRIWNTSSSSATELSSLDGTLPLNQQHQTNGYDSMAPQQTQYVPPGSSEEYSGQADAEHFSGHQYGFQAPSQLQSLSTSCSAHPDATDKKSTHDNGITPLQPFSFVVPPPKHFNRRQSGTLAYRRAAPACELSIDITQYAQTGCLYDRELPPGSLSHMPTASLLSHASNASYTEGTTFTPLRLRSMSVGSPQFMRSPITPARPSLSNSEIHLREGLADHTLGGTALPSSPPRIRINLGSLGGLDLGPFGSGGVAECSEEDEEEEGEQVQPVDNTSTLPAPADCQHDNEKSDENHNASA